MSDLIQMSHRRSTAANWAADDPVLLEGERGLETDTKFQKIGDGVTAWSALPYWHGPPWINSFGDAGPASTFPGAPFNPHGMMGTAPFIPPPPPPNTTLGDPNYADYAIYGVGYDPVNDVVLIGVSDYDTAGRGGDFRKLLITDSSLSAPTAMDMPDITGWVTGTFEEFNYIQYSQSLSRWVAFTGRGFGAYCDGDPSVGANWIEVTYPAAWAGVGAFNNIRRMIWSHSLEMFIVYADGNTNDYLTVSVDGITWSLWSDYQVLGGISQEFFYQWLEGNINGSYRHVLFQQEDYITKDGNAGAGVLPGAAQGWTKSSNNGVMRNTSQVRPDWAATDGSVYAVTVLNELNATDFSLSHPDRWGPDGNANQGWLDPDMGWANFNHQKSVFFYLPQYARPWFVFRVGGITVDPLDHGWFDCSDISYHPIRTPANAPQFARCTVEPFATYNAEYDADRFHYPANYPVTGTNYGIAETGYDAGHVLGTTGWFLVNRTDVSRTKDYLNFFPPI